MVSETSQLSIFETIRDLLLANSTLSKFKKSNYVIFENIKPILPQIIINVPTTTTDLLTLSHKITMKEFNDPIIMKLEWSARDKVVEYANAIIYQIESNEASLALNRIHSPKIELTDVDEEVEDSRKIIVAQFELTYNTDIARA